MTTQPSPLDKMQSSVQLAAFHYIACLKTIPSNADHKIKISNLEYRFINIKTVEQTALHANFQNWAASSVVRDLIENFSIFMMEIYRDAVLNAPARTFSTTPFQFERKGIEDQLGILAKEFSIAPEWIARLTGYNRARNCLAHRAGVVGLPDATHGSELVVRWIGVTLPTLTEGPPSQIVDVKGPMSGLFGAQNTHGNSAVSVDVPDREKKFGVGCLLQFLPQEVLEICQTFQFASTAINGIKTTS